MSDFEVVDQGFDVLMARLQAMPGNAQEMALQRMEDFARDVIMKDSKDNYCPFRYGALYDSGIVYREGDMIKMEYGNPAAFASLNGNPPNQYAVIQHEVQFNHPDGKSWKYLEIPLVNHTPGLLDAAATGVKAGLEITESGAYTIQKMTSQFPVFEPVAEAPKKSMAPRLIKKPKL